MNRAAFFDRDGTINFDGGHVHRVEDLAFIPGRPELIRAMNRLGYRVIVVTNQSGIARGLYTPRDLTLFHARMNAELGARWGARIDAFYFCPHHPDITGPCECRKPKPGLILRAIRDFSLDAAASVLYGDRATDMEAGAAAGLGRCVLLQSNGGRAAGGLYLP